MSKTSDSKSNDSVFHPDKSVVKQARIKEYDKLYAESIRDREGFWEKEAKILSGTRNGIRYWMIQINHFINGLPAVKPIWWPMPLTVI